MSITLSSNFQLNAQLPLDARLIQDDSTARDAILTDQRYFGMVVTLLADGTSWLLADVAMGGTDNNVATNANWIAFGGGGSSLDLQTNGVDNGSQSILNLVAGMGVVLTDDGMGNVSIDVDGTGPGNLIGSTAGIVSGGTPGITIETWLGYQAGANGASNSATVFIGVGAGNTATNAYDAVFVGTGAGQGSTNAYESIFIGNNAGNVAQNASNAIFIGFNAGFNDVVNNNTTPSNHSILIGDQTSTGGFSSSIALGTSAENTSVNQFMIGNSSPGGNDGINLITIPGYLNSRDDTLSFTPQNFLYSDSVGNLFSSPLSALPGPFLLNTQIPFGDSSNEMTSNGNSSTDGTSYLTFIRSVGSGQVVGLDISNNVLGLGAVGFSLQAYDGATSHDGIFQGVSINGASLHGTIIGAYDPTFTAPIAFSSYDIQGGSGQYFLGLTNGNSLGDFVGFQGDLVNGWSFQGVDNLGTTSTLVVQNKSNNNLFDVYNDGSVKINNAYILPTTNSFVAGDAIINDGSGGATWGAPTPVPLTGPLTDVLYFDATTGDQVSDNGFTRNNLSNFFTNISASDGTSVTDYVSIGAGAITLNENDSIDLNTYASEILINITGINISRTDNSSSLLTVVRVTDAEAALTFTNNNTGFVTGISAQNNSFQIFNSDGGTQTTWTWAMTDGNNGDALITNGSGGLMFGPPGGLAQPNTQILVGTGTGVTSRSSLTAASDRFAYDGPVNGNDFEVNDGSGVTQANVSLEFNIGAAAGGQMFQAIPNSGNTIVQMGAIGYGNNTVLVVADDVETISLAATNIALSGLTYVFPASHGMGGFPLLDDGAGNLTWGALPFTAIGSLPSTLAGYGILDGAAIVTENNLVGRTTALTGIVSISSTPADETYRIGGYLTITSVTLDVIQLQVTYVDETSTTRTQTFFPQGLTSANLGSVGAFTFPPMDIRTKMGTTVSVNTVLITGTGSIVYDIGVSIMAI